MHVFIMLVCLSLRSELVCMCVRYAYEFGRMYVSESVSICVQDSAQKYFKIVKMSMPYVHIYGTF